MQASLALRRYLIYLCRELRNEQYGVHGARLIQPIGASLTLRILNKSAEQTNYFKDEQYGVHGARLAQRIRCQPRATHHEQPEQTAKCGEHGEQQ